jgi:Arc/MetJ-type ribon-helix-helix transcriptional regulator
MKRQSLHKRGLINKPDGFGALTMNDRKLKRLTVEIGPETEKIIESLRSDLGLKTSSEVIRAAIRFLSFYNDERQKGNRIGIIADSTGEVRQVEVL